MDSSTDRPVSVPVEPGHKRRLFTGWWLSFLGYFSMITSIVVWFVIFALAMESFGEIAGLLFFIITLPVIFLATPTFTGLIARGRSMRAMNAQELLQRDRRSAVVFLRSFDDDDLIDPSFPATNQLVPGRYENKLTRVLASIGPVVALGRPGESDPELGAARLYITDEHWQQAISDLIADAALVVAIVGDSPGLWWEIEFSIQRVRPERLLFFLPYPVPQKTRQSYWRSAFLQNPIWGRFMRRKLFPEMEEQRQARYEIFRQRMSAKLPHPLPEKLGEARFIAFSNEGRPLLIEPAKPALLTRAITLNFNPLLDIPFKKELQSVVDARKLSP